MGSVIVRKCVASHPALDRAERMLRRLTAQPHGIGVVVEPRLHRLEHGLVLPARDAAFGPCRALGLERAGPAGARPIAAQRLAVLLAREAIGQPLAGGTAIDVIRGDIDEVLLAEAALGFGAGVSGFGSVTVMPASSQALISSPS